MLPEGRGCPPRRARSATSARTTRSTPTGASVSRPEPRATPTSTSAISRASTADTHCWTPQVRCAC